MQHKFYPSLLGRLGYFVAAILIGVAFLLLCLFLIFPFGEIFAADGLEVIDLILFLLSMALTLFLGLASLYYLINAISPYPYLIIDTEHEEIHFRALGTFGHVKMKWYAIRHTKPKGILKHLYLQILIPQQLDIKRHQNIVFKLAFRTLKYTYYLVSLKFWKMFRTRAYQYTQPDIIHLYRTSVGVPLSKIEEILDARFEADQVPNDFVMPTIPASERAVVRIKPGHYSRSLGKMLNRFSVFAVCTLPLLFGLISFTGYLIDSQSDPKIQEAQALRLDAFAGDAAAQNEFGELLLNGIGVPKSSMRANRWFRKSADQGNYKAQYNLGLSYECTRRDKSRRKKRRDCQKAIDWFHKSAKQNYAPAIKALKQLGE